MKFGLSIYIIALLLTFQCNAQKQANVWYFGEHTGLDFITEPPSALNGLFDAHRNNAAISDSSGNFLFATNGEKIWNRNKQIMQNGDNLKGNYFASQGVIIVQKPKSDHLYYVFTVPDFQYSTPPGLYFSVVDMNLDGGIGAVTNEKNIPVALAWDAYEKVMAVRHANNKDIWIITRKHEFDSYASFLLTESGLNPDPVISYSPDRPYEWLLGSMKISYNKKYMIAAYTADFVSVPPDYSLFNSYDICSFNAETGQIELMYILNPDFFGGSETPNSVEFSPDSKLVYLSNWATDGSYNRVYNIYQYDMSQIEDSLEFISSKVLITNKGGSGLQLARDGQIYCGSKYRGLTDDSLNVIHKPWVRGAGCGYEANFIPFLEGTGSRQFLPNLLLDYLYRFEWEGQCQSSPFVFQSNFQPEPEFISWNFGDPSTGGDNFSNDINPQHLFSAPGEYEVSVYVRYPSDRIEQTSRVVTVEDIPHPSLGPDVVVCEGEEVLLNAGDEEGMYTWSTGTFGLNLNEITVSDSGWYWVRLRQDIGCFGIDSIFVGWYPKAIINEDNLSLVPTTCGGNNGKILGLQVSGFEPLSFGWFDADSNFLASTLDLINFPVGNYYLHILDGNGCTTISTAYTITDAGDIEINIVETQNSHCGQSQGEIRIGANSLGTDYLLYSIDNGSTWQANDSLFQNLPAGNYVVRVSDTSGCESVFANNPVVVENIAGPDVTAVNSNPETDFLQNGEIDISANANSGQLYFSIDGGTSFQTGNGLFSNLSAGTYSCLVKDDFLCDTTFTVSVERVYSQLIEAIAGNGNACIGNAAVVPLKLSNFTDIFKFYVKLSYDTAVLSCDGYINVNPALEAGLQASIIPGTDEVIISWQGEMPTTLEENATMLELVFGAKAEGISGIDWAAAPGESAFYNEQLEQISAVYHVGLLRVYTRPKIMMGDERKACEGEDVLATPFIQGGSGEVTYFWQGPNGFESTKSYIEFVNIAQQNAGIYNLTVTDTIDCVESMEMKMIVNESPIIAFAGQDTIFTQSGFILEAGSGYESYLWNTNETTESITINDEGLYSVLVTTNQSCESSDSVRVLFEVDLQTAFYLPNAFTPDGDGLNDEFKPVEKYDFVKTYQLSIFNRWGQLIFETSNISHGWDGTYQGNPVEQGSYVYKIIFTAYPDYSKQQIVTGNVVVVR